MLQERGIDAIAVTQDPELRGTADETLLIWATAEGRVLVTENIGDFAFIAGQWALARQAHPGLVFTSPRRFHRGSKAYPHDVASALIDLDASGWPTEESEVRWL